MQSVPIITNVESLNPAREVYSIQHYVKKICQQLATGRGFSPVSFTNKTDRQDTTEILLKVVLNTIPLTHIDMRCELVVCFVQLCISILNFCIILVKIFCANHA